jgi:hypothetical protein
LCEATKADLDKECAKAAKNEPKCKLSKSEEDSAKSILKKCADAADRACGKNTLSIDGEPRTSTSASSPKDETLASDSTSSKTKLQSPEEKLPVPAQSIGLPIGAFDKKTNTNGAFIAGVLVVLALVAIITLLIIRRRPPQTKKFTFQFEQIKKKSGRR